MKSMKIGIVGLGSLGSALLKGLTRSGVAPSDIIICVRPEKVTEFSESLSVNVTGSFTSAAEFADTVFLTVKKNVFDEITKEFKTGEFTQKTFVSFMAGVPFPALKEKLGKAEIVRAMPSLAIATQNGVIGYTKCAANLAALLEKLGYAFEVEMEDIEKVTAFASCGLGFAAYFLEAFSQAGQNLGFPRGQADAIAARTFENACKRGGDFQSLVKSVATKGGATEQGVNCFEKYNLNSIVEEAIRAAYEKVK